MTSGVKVDIIAQGANPPAETTPPFITNKFPLPLSIDQPRNTNISFTANDTDSGIDIDTLTVTVQQGVGAPSVAIQNGVFQLGWNGAGSSITPVGLNYDIVIDPTILLIDFDTVIVTVTVFDLAPEPNSVVDNWSFTTADETAPVVSNRDPSPNTFGNPNDTNIQFTIDDVGTGVDLTSIVVTVIQNGTPAIAYDGGAGGFQIGFQGPASLVTPLGQGFVFVVDPETDLVDGSIQIDIQADDLATVPNHLSETYAWSTLEGLGVNKYRVATPDNFSDREINAFQLYSKPFIEESLNAIGQKSMVALDGNQYGAYEIPATGRLFQSLEIIDPGGNNLGLSVVGESFETPGTFISGFVPRRDSAGSLDEAEQFVSFLITQADVASIPFENSSFTYFVGLAFSLKPSVANPNPRSGQSNYTEFEAILGWKVKPTNVVDNLDGSITLTLPNSSQSLLGNKTLAGRTGTVFLKDAPAPQAATADAIKSATIVWTGSANEVTVTQLGQADPPSTDPNDYNIIVEGPLITDTDISPGGGAEFGIAYIGSIVGVTKVTNEDEQAITPNAFILTRDVLRFTEPSTNTVGVRAAKILVRAKTGEAGEFQLEVKNAVGVTTFSVDEAGNLIAAGIVASPAVGLHLTNDDGAAIRHFAADIRDVTLGQTVQQTLDGIGEFTGGIDWADGTTNPATTVDLQLQKILADLAEISLFRGARKISAEPVASSPESLSSGTLQSQLVDLLAFINARLPLDGSEVMVGDLLKDSSTRSLGGSGANAQWRGEFEIGTFYGGAVLKSGVNLTPEDATCDLGMSVLPFGEAWINNTYTDEIRPRTGVDIRCEDLLPLVDNTYVLGAAGFRWQEVVAVLGTFNQTDAGDLTVTRLVSDFIPDLGGASHRSIGTINPPLTDPGFSDPRPNIYADTLQSIGFQDYVRLGIGVPGNLDDLRQYHIGLQVRAAARINGVSNSVTGLHFNVVSPVVSPSAGQYEITLDLGEDNTAFPTTQYIPWFTVGPVTLVPGDEWTWHFNWTSFTRVDVQFNLGGIATDPGNFIFVLLMTI